MPPEHRGKFSQNNHNKTPRRGVDSASLLEELDRESTIDLTGYLIPELFEQAKILRDAASRRLEEVVERVKTHNNQQQSNGDGPNNKK